LHLKLHAIDRTHGKSSGAVNKSKSIQ